jgi:anti-sigma B factor antagonist
MAGRQLVLAIARTVAYSCVQERSVGRSSLVQLSPGEGWEVVEMSRNGAAPDQEHRPFSVATEETGDGLRLVVRGDLDLASAREFGRAVAAAQRENPATMVVDLSALDFLDSRGLKEVLSAKALCEQRGCELRLIAGEQARRLFEMTGLSASLPLISREGQER